MKIEQEFKDTIKKVYPTIDEESLQFKASRVMFYMGAFAMISAKSLGETQDELRESVKELRGALKLAAEFAKKGLHPEDTLADYAER